MLKIINKYRAWKRGIRFGAKYTEGTCAVLELDPVGSMLLGDASSFRVMPVFYKTPEVAIRAVRRLQQLGDGKTYAVAVMPRDFIISAEK
jgi:hypothetical protein